ncbi:hypothetical protein CC80DRAFT_498917 [Byssothecium circinans]|uniref:Uncharacterized protein n=1 Tax=Byssothecium circinans TaxID=147558 RepID=A0A6A5UGN7_9PLEO|nr:hypothetical protein CC80DRAFT_498917 [Byssothecium circinans]
MPALPVYEATASPTNSLGPRILAVANSLNAKIIRPRQEIVPGIIPTYYRIDGPAPGTVAGIVLGSVAGTVLIVWLLFSLTQGNVKANGSRNTIAGEEEIVVRRRRGSQSHAARSSRRSSRPVVREYSRSPRRSGGGRSTVIVEERRPAPRARSIVVDERSRSRVRNDDVVEVIEEVDDYRPARGSRRYG